ncbi:MAG: DUF1553 domain-containing protein [Planctomycetaceae bacterium]
MFTPNVWFLCAGLIWLSAGSALVSVVVAADEVELYLKQIKPILKERCYSCHGPLKQEAGLRLDTVAAMQQGGESGPAFVTTDLDASLILQKISAADDTVRMPPEGKPLTAEQIDAIRQWIASGGVPPEGETPEADPREHWSFQPPMRPPLPQIKSATWARNPIDLFIAREHDRLGLTPGPEADPAVLMRRVYIDLVGIPPTREELGVFLNQYAETGDQAYDRLVDRLLDSPQYGERWGRHWMDVWRYSDWYGRRSVNDVRNSAPHVWRWRDWIVRSLNDDRSYADMLSMMLAADELKPGDDSEVVATGFIVRNWYSLNYDTWMRDMVEHTGKAFLGVRMNCNLCHDHKYDPIAQEDHFRFRAFFEPLEFRHDRVPGGPPLDKYIRYNPKSGSSLAPTPAGLARIYEENLKAETFVYRGGDAREIIKNKPPVQPGVPAVFRGTLPPVTPVTLPPQAFYPGVKPFVREQETATARSALATAEKELAAIQTEYDAQIPAMQQQLDAAQQKLTDAEKAIPPDEKPNSQIADVDKHLIGHWRFEGEGDELFLSDHSGRHHKLQRVAGSDPPVSPFVLPLTTKGMGATFPPPPVINATTESTRGASNRQAAQFHQHQNFAFLAADPHVDFAAEQFTFETLLHVAASSPNMNRTMSELPGSWLFMHRGLNDKSSELRLLYFNPAGETREVVTAGGDQPLLLATGRDYYVALIMGRDQVTLAIRDLTSHGDLQTHSVPRNPDNQDFSTLARSKPAGPLRIGNSDGTGRHVGLMDEVRLWNRELNITELELLSAQPQENPIITAARKDVLSAQMSLDALTAKLEAARAKVAQTQAQIASIEARIAADDVRFLGAAGDVREASKQAFRAEKAAALATAQLQLAQAKNDLLQQQLNLTVISAMKDPAADETAMKEAASKEAAANDALVKAEKAIQAAQTSVQNAVAETMKEGESYTPFSPEYPATSTGRRAALAHWLADPGHPRTSRVAVNHIWLRHFGRALVEPVYDIGPSAKEPTHRDLIDWLSVEFTEHNWSMKRLHRLIVTSSTYRLASSVSSNDAILKAEIQRCQGIDKDNRYYWMSNSRRLEAEVVRDSLLHLSGELDNTIGGPELDNVQDIASKRRSLYFLLHPEDGGAMPFLSLFDPPDPTDCYRRSETLIPQQALAMVNGELTQQCSRRLTKRLLSAIAAEGETSTDAFISAAFAHILSRPPTSAELDICRDFLAQQINGVKTANSAGELPAADAASGPSPDPEIRAKESLIRTLFNHHEFITIH